MQKRRHFAILLVLVAGLSAAYLNPIAAVPATGSAAASVADLSESQYFEHVKFLSRDEMKGRASGSPELDKAADYIAGQFRSWGLRPMGDGNTFFQRFQLTTGARLGSNNQLQINATKLKINDDFVPIVFSSTARFEGPLVFAGYGITASNLHFDEYAGIDAKGKIVIVLRHEPQESDANSPFDGTNFTTHASFVNKVINAKQHGARGIIFITDINHADEQVGPATRTAETDDLGIPAVHAKRETVIALLKAAGKDLDAIQKSIDKDLKPQSF